MDIDIILDLLADKVADKVIQRLNKEEDAEPVYTGIKGIMQIFHCGRTKAQALKNSHVLDEAIISHGRKFVINKGKALDCVAKKGYM